MRTVQVCKLDPNAKLPTRTYSTDAGLDIFSTEDVFITAGTTQVVATGVAIQISEGYVGKIEDRSSMGLKGLRTGAGVIDCGFTGELKVVLHNLNNRDNEYLGVRGYWVRKGDKIAQMLLYKVETPEVIEVDSLWESDRGSKGFGSSGRQ